MKIFATGVPPNKRRTNQELLTIIIPCDYNAKHSEPLPLLSLCPSVVSTCILQLLHSQEIDQQGGVENLAQHIRSSLTVSEREDSCQPPLLGVEVLCCAYAADGDIFAIGASDGVVRIYADDANKVPVLRVELHIRIRLCDRMPPLSS